MTSKSSGSLSEAAMGSERRTIAEESALDRSSNIGDDGEVVKREVIVLEHLGQGYECSALQLDTVAGSVEEKPPLSRSSDTSPTPSLSAPSPSSVMGKRKIKPKEVYDELLFFRIRNRKRKKKVLSSKSEPALSDHAKKSMSKRRRTASNGSDNFVEVKTSAMIRAEEVQASLGSEFPCFMKLLVRSHVSSCFWMGLPVPFCKLHLPRKDSPVILEDEKGQQFEMKFIAEKTGLSAGWRKFAYAHKLLEGDVLIFQLVEPSKFKVYIVREKDLTEVDGALSLLNLEAHAKPDDSEKDDVKDEMTLKDKKMKHQKCLPLVAVQRKKKTSLLNTMRKPLQQVEPFENDSEEVGSDIIAGPRFSCSAIQFRDVKSFEHFSIVVDGICIDSELPECTRAKYYELCCSKNAFLHARVLRGINCNLIAGIISETVNIADALKACMFMTPRDEFAVWEKTLKSFELLGMNVGFLRARLRHLLSLAHESEDAIEVRRYAEAKTEKARVVDEIRNIEAKLIELLEDSEKYDGIIEALKSKAGSYELKFQEEVNAPW